MSNFTWALRKAGFVNQQGLIDRKKCIDFLQVSERTLERWMKDSKPCSAGYQQSQIMQQQGKLKNLAHIEKMKKEIARLASEIQNITTHTESELHAFELTLLDPQNRPSLKIV